MKNGQANSVVDRFTVIDKLDETNVIAVREKASVQLDESRKEVKMHVSFICKCALHHSIFNTWKVSRI